MDQQTSLKMIEELSNAYGASGFEDDVLLVGRKYGEGLARIEENCIRDLFFYRNENTGDKPVILLDGHSDEVSFMVQAIKPNGTRSLSLWADGWKTMFPPTKSRFVTPTGNIFPVWWPVNRRIL